MFLPAISLYSEILSSPHSLALPIFANMFAHRASTVPHVLSVQRTEMTACKTRDSSFSAGIRQPLESITHIQE